MVTTDRVSPTQRHTRRHPCLVCQGSRDDRPGVGRRCWGYLSDDERFEYCTREELAGNLPPNQTRIGTAYRHWVAGGPCRCGETHPTTAEAPRGPHDRGHRRQEAGPGAADHGPITRPLRLVHPEHGEPTRGFE
jgi:hypothetical protein